MCHCRRYHGIGLVGLGVLVMVVGFYHRDACPSHCAQLSRHIAEVCGKAAGEVR